MRGTDGYPMRVRFTKQGKVRFISHRDVARSFERAFRIERLPLVFTAGFSPRPKVSFGHALSVGYESDAEYLDFEVSDELDADRLPIDLSAVLPVGIDVTGCAPLLDRAPALQEAVTVVGYESVVEHPDGRPANLGELQSVVADVLGRDELRVVRSRKGRDVEDDVRPTVRDLQAHATGPDEAVLRLEVATQPRGARPREVLDALGTDLREGRVRRTYQWIERGGARLEPLEADRRSRAAVPGIGAPKLGVEARAS